MHRAQASAKEAIYIHSLAAPPTTSGLRLGHDHRCSPMASGHVASNQAEAIDKFIHSRRS